MSNFQTIAGWRLRHLVDIIDLSSINTICDIGALDLSQSFEMLQVMPQAKVFAFEPYPKNYNKSLENLKQSGSQNINLYQMALGDKTRMIKFYPMCDDNPGASSKYKLMGKDVLDNLWGGRWSNYQIGEIEVFQDTLDNWRSANNIDKIDLIWMDVQGGELDVLKGAKETLKDVKVILTEVGLQAYYEGQSLKPEIDIFLGELGFYELENTFEYNGSYCEANTIYVKSSLSQ